jgi:putative ABC transport system permease protein
MLIGARRSFGDLREEFASRVSTHGPREARYWYCRQAVALISRRLASRLGANMRHDGRCCPHRNLPRRRGGMRDCHAICGTPGAPHSRGRERAWSSFFDAMRIRLLAGRAFNSGDHGDTRAVAVVSQSLVDRYWPGEDPLGRRFRLSADGDWINVVGVVGDVLQDWSQQRRAPTVYRPLAQDAPFTQAFVVRTVADPTGIAGDLRRAVATADPDQPIMDLKRMEDLIVDRSSGIVFLAGMLGVVAAIAFVLAITGVYSLMMFMASRRTQEIGVRMALGASWWHVIRVATAQAVRITVSGVALGGLLAAALGRSMASVLMEGVVSSLWQLGALAGMLTAVALTAAYLPARRAARIDPTLALRAE